MIHQIGDKLTFGPKINGDERRHLGEVMSKGGYHLLVRALSVDPGRAATTWMAPADVGPYIPSHWENVGGRYVYRRVLTDAETKSIFGDTLNL